MAAEQYETPSADFKVLRRFLPYLWPRNAPELRMRIVGALLLLLLGRTIFWTQAFALANAIDTLAERTSAALALGIGLVLAYALVRFAAVLFDNLRNAIFERVSQTGTRQLATQVFDHLHNLSLRFHLERRTGQITRVMERATKGVDEMLYFLLFNLAPTAIEIVVVSGLLWWKIGWELTLATLAMVVAYVWFTWKVTEWRNQLRREAVDHDNKAATRAVDSLLNYETVKYFNAERVEARRYAQAYDRFSDAAVKNEVSLAWLNIGQSFITNLLMAGALAFTVWRWYQGGTSVGDVVLVSTLLTQFFRPLDVLGWVYRTVNQGLIDMGQMFQLLDTQAEIKDAPDAVPLVTRGGHIRFDDVHFAYDPRREILHGISFEARPGQKVAVVGHTGAGKSTLSRILYRFYEIGAGSVTVDGQDIRHVTQTSLRRAIGIVPQDTVLFNDTIGYNIAYGREGATREEIEDAARQAQIHDFVTSLPDGYDTMVGERGLKLSGGEKQRVAIARTILKDPCILILDEATSALDSRTEAEIGAALERVGRGRTTLVVAHRLSTVIDSDLILVMDQGRIIERGTHEALVAAGGTYADMWARQQAEREAERAAA